MECGAYLLSTARKPVKKTANHSPNRCNDELFQMDIHTWPPAALLADD